MAIHAIAADTHRVPETPRWLVQRAVSTKRRVLARLGSRDGTLEEIQAAVARERTTNARAGRGSCRRRAASGAILVGVAGGRATTPAEEASLFTCRAFCSTWARREPGLRRARGHGRAQDAVYCRRRDLFG